MLNDNARALVAALRSGNYKQGKGALRDKTDNFCCLGVACDLYIVATNMSKWEDQYSNYDAYTIGGLTSALPSEVMNWLGMADALGKYSRGSENFISLATDNDTGATFAEIADLIESEPEGLFK